MSVKHEITLTPHEIVARLDEYIVGQAQAKRAVAIALRNRYRRAQLAEELREEFVPKNILMMGPTGVGKTEIARRLAKLVRAPFVKVEASKFTEVGYVGRDVDSIARDLAEAAVHMVREEKIAAVQDRAAQMAEEDLLAALLPQRKKETSNPLAALIPGLQQPQPTEPEDAGLPQKKAELKLALEQGKLENTQITIEVTEAAPVQMMPGGMEIDMSGMMGGLMPPRTKQRTLTVAEARPVLREAAAEKLINKEDINSEALARAANHGIVFLDEIDKIASAGEGQHGPDVSREGVQRDLLPLIEGSTVATKYGPLKTDHVLFIAAGAFHVARPEDLIPELQGRFPVRVSLQPLTVEDFVRILTQTKKALLAQYTALLAVDNVQLDFTGEGVRALAEFAFQRNEMEENLGARRLHGAVEQLLEDISFNAGGDHPTVVVQVDQTYVSQHLTGEKRDLDKFIL